MNSSCKVEVYSCTYTFYLWCIDFEPNGSVQAASFNKLYLTYDLVNGSLYFDIFGISNFIFARSLLKVLLLPCQLMFDSGIVWFVRLGDFVDKVYTGAFILILAWGF